MQSPLYIFHGDYVLCHADMIKMIKFLFLHAQVYNLVEKQFHFRDKHYGRKLTEDEFYQALKEFLFNGRCYRRDVVPGLLIMLRWLRDVIGQQDSFRFFASSLLVMYDGCVSDVCENDDGIEEACLQWTRKDNFRGINFYEEQPPNLSEIRKLVDLRMIDFAHSTHKGYLHDKVIYHGPDERYLAGLTTLINALEQMFKD